MDLKCLSGLLLLLLTLSIVFEVELSTVFNSLLLLLLLKGQSSQSIPDRPVFEDVIVFCVPPCPPPFTDPPLPTLPPQLLPALLPHTL